MHRSIPYDDATGEFIGVAKFSRLGSELLRKHYHARRQAYWDRPYREAREAFERLYFEHLLARENGSMSKVAEHSGLERTHLYRKLKALGLPVGRREEN